MDFPQGVENRMLHGTPDGLLAIDRLYLDAINGNDDNDGLTVQSAIKSFKGLAEKFSLGRSLEVRLLSEIDADHLLGISYIVPALIFSGVVLMILGGKTER